MNRQATCNLLHLLKCLVEFSPKSMVSTSTAQGLEKNIYFQQERIIPFNGGGSENKHVALPKASL